jgi:hypothetical protein
MERSDLPKPEFIAEFAKGEVEPGTDICWAYTETHQLNVKE